MLQGELDLTRVGCGPAWHSLIACGPLEVLIFPGEESCAGSVVMGPPALDASWAQLGG